MTHRIETAVLSAILFGTVIAAPARGANLLVNGSFESWSGGITPSNQPDRIFNDSSLAVPGWNFAIGLSSDLYRDQNASGAQSNYYSAAHLDYLAGSGSFSTLHEGISQTFTVVPNTVHKLTFKMAPGGLNYNGGWIEYASVGSSWLVELNGALVTPISTSFSTNLADFDPTGTTNPLAWTPQTLYFGSDAVGGSVTLKFTAYGDMTHVFLDDVSVIEVPTGTSFCAPEVGGVAPCPCSNPQVPVGDARGCDNSSLTGGAQLTSSGMPSVTAGSDTAKLTSSGEKPSALSIFLSGSSNLSAGVTFGQGIRCVGSPLKRLYNHNASGGVVSAPVGADPDMHTRHAQKGDPLVAGDVRYYQVYYRDQTVLGGCPSTSTFNVSQGQVFNWVP